MWWLSIDSSDSSRNWALTAVAKLRRRPPLLGTARQRELNVDRRVHEVMSFLSVTLSRIPASLVAARCRDARGILFTILTDEGRRCSSGEVGV